MGIGVVGGGVWEWHPHLASHQSPAGFPVASLTALQNSVVIAPLMHHTFSCSLCW